MPIRMQTFNALPNLKKAQLTLEKGTVLVRRKQQHAVITLYALSDFYVEIWYDSKSMKIDKIRSFRDSKALDAYIDDINLDI